MSEQRFKEAKSNLAFSQSLVDRMKQSQMPQQPAPDTSTPAPQDAAPQVPQPQEVAPTPQPPDQGIVQTIKDTIAPFMDKITNLLTKQSEETKQVELKIDGEMTPKAQ